MKKQISIILIILLLVFSVFAQSDTQNEVNAIHNVFGAELRFSQLEYVLNRNIMQGELTIKEILKNNAEYDVTELESLLDQLKKLLEKVENLDLTEDKNDLAALFIGFKFDAVKISKDFKMIAKEKLPLGNQNIIKEQVKEQTQLKSQVKNVIDQYNAEQVKNMFKHMGVQDEVFVDKVKNGIVSKSEIKSRLMDGFNELSKESRSKVKMKMLEEESKKQVFQNQAMSQYQNNKPEDGKGNEIQEKGENQGNPDSGNNDINGNDNSGNDQGSNDLKGVSKDTAESDDSGNSGNTGGSDSSGSSGNTGGDSGGNSGQGGTDGANGGGK
ncbi:hypothetical protein HOD20_08020 [archaeon]|jgi:uncharacterized membrane protein YgcG|nr:hypothetical protein [archaeon]MBT4352455.1 hypothetical protein [archaeon]MBT4648000.1 hypothetical protein [archaeon]MBT6820916.1 hypothetical protein [archaeon]MBT7392324.1 hypothetical protein [archaeon]